MSCCWMVGARMSKPDWAERLQRTFQRKFDAGVWAERVRIVELLAETLDHDYDIPSKDGWSGDMLHVEEFCTKCRAIALIKEENK